MSVRTCRDSQGRPWGPFETAKDALAYNDARQGPCTIDLTQYVPGWLFLERLWADETPEHASIPRITIPVSLRRV
jgi:hypothetical protein